MIYQFVAREALRQYYAAWSEVLDQDELNRLGEWFAGGCAGDLPPGLVEKLHQKPRTARKVFFWQRVVVEIYKRFGPRAGMSGGTSSLDSSAPDSTSRCGPTAGRGLRVGPWE